MTRRKVLTHPVVPTEHVFDKIRSIGMALAEFEELLGGGEVIEEHDPSRVGSRSSCWLSPGDVRCTWSWSLMLFEEKSVCHRVRAGSWTLETTSVDRGADAMQGL